jgi:hypothetical protein
MLIFNFNSAPLLSLCLKLVNKLPLRYHQSCILRTTRAEGINQDPEADLRAKKSPATALFLPSNPASAAVPHF